MDCWEIRINYIVWIFKDMSLTTNDLNKSKSTHNVNVYIHMYIYVHYHRG